MRSRTLALAALLAVASPAGADGLAEAWSRVQQELSAATPAGLEGRIRELQAAAAEVGARRLTPYAMALVAWAREHPGESGELAARQAQILDPLLAGPPFLLARWQWASRSYPQAAGSYLMGWLALVRNDETRRQLQLATVLWTLNAVGVAVLIAIALQVAHHARLMIHDARELGLLLFGPANAVIFAVVVLLLPVFAALGPLWLVAYLFALTWSYMGRSQLVAAIVSTCLLTAFGPALEAWQQSALRVSPLQDRVVTMLEGRRLDPSSLRELADLEPSFQSIATYHLIMGELMRLHGDSVAAQVAFRKAAAADPHEPLAPVFLGNLAMELGDVHRAVQHYAVAVTADDRCAFAYVNLAFAYDQSLRFQEGTEARNRARELAGKSVTELGVAGLNPRIRYPELGKAEVDAMLSQVSPQARQAAALGSPGPSPLGLLLTPLSAVFWVTGLIGGGVLAARRRWGWKAAHCAKCGRVFCPRCKTSNESSSYCSQCTSVFLKRDVVAIEQQAAKRGQVQRWETLTAWLRRLVAIAAPGGAAVLDGKVWIGLGIGFLGWLTLLGAVVFTPGFVPGVEPLASAVPAQVALSVAAAATWGWSAVSAWRGK